MQPNRDKLCYASHVTGTSPQSPIHPGARRPFDTTNTLLHSAAGCRLTTIPAHHGRPFAVQPTTKSQEIFQFTIEQEPEDDYGLLPKETIQYSYSYRPWLASYQWLSYEGTE